MSDSDPGSYLIVQAPAIDVVKTSTPQTVISAGEVVTYDYLVTNTGNVTLSGITLVDDVEGIITLAATTLAPGASTTGSTTHTITAADIAAGSLSNVGLATGTPPSGPPVTDDDPKTVNFVNLSLAKSAAIAEVTAIVTNQASVGADLGAVATDSVVSTVVIASGTPIP